MHDHHDTDDRHGRAVNERSVGLAALLTGAFMVAEVAGGLIAGSLALLADAGHMLTDFAALALAWLGFRMTRRPADWRRTYGFDRFSVLVAFVNGIALFAIAAWIVIEAVQRLRAPVQVQGGIMLWVATAGLVVIQRLFEHREDLRVGKLGSEQRAAHRVPWTPGGDTGLARETAMKRGQRRPQRTARVAHQLTRNSGSEPE